MFSIGWKRSNCYTDPVRMCVCASSKNFAGLRDIPVHQSTAIGGVRFFTGVLSFAANAKQEDDKKILSNQIGSIVMCRHYCTKRIETRRGQWNNR